MNIFDHLAEERIREALAQGALSGLPGEGKPLQLDDDALVPVEVRMSNRILRNAGYVPSAVADLRELQRLCSALADDGGGAAGAALSNQRMLALVARIEAAGLSHVSAVILGRLASRKLG